MIPRLARRTSRAGAMRSGSRTGTGVAVARVTGYRQASRARCDARRLAHATARLPTSILVLETSRKEIIRNPVDTPRVPR